jgi:hypothetical protein
MRVAIVSSVYGGYDQPSPGVPQFLPDAECEYVLVTDQPYDCHPWRVVVEPRPQLHPRLAAKVAKCRPDLYADADFYVWMDTSFHVNAVDFVSWMVSHLEHGPMAQIRHPDRSRIVDEADVSAHMTKYAGLPVKEQAAHYVERGYPDGWGLWATGLIGYRSCPEAQVFGDAWLREQMRFTYQDQLSEAPVLHALGLKPVDLPGPLLGHPKFTIRAHRDDQ